MMFQLDIEKDDVKFAMQGAEYTVGLNAEVEVEYTPPRGEVRGKDNSCVEPPTGADLDVSWAETTLLFYNDHGEEIGELVFKGVEFFESLVDINDEEIEIDVEDLL